jgi:hypothetical protein
MRMHSSSFAYSLSNYLWVSKIAYPSSNSFCMCWSCGLLKKNRADQTSKCSTEARITIAAMITKVIMKGISNAYRNDFHASNLCAPAHCRAQLDTLAQVLGSESSTPWPFSLRGDADLELDREAILLWDLERQVWDWDPDRECWLETLGSAAAAGIPSLNLAWSWGGSPVLVLSILWFVSDSKCLSGSSSTSARFLSTCSGFLSPKLGLRNSGRRSVTSGCYSFIIK